MKSSLLAFAFISATLACFSENLPPLPSPVTDSAVTSVRVENQILVYSFMGMGPKKTWDSATNAASALNVKYNKWTTIRAVPGSGRLGAVAVSAREQIFLLGGFVPDQSGLQAIVPDVSVYDPIGLRWYRGPDLPTPVRDAVAGVYRDRYIYVVGGFSKQGPTNAVQVYDVQEQRWMQGTASPGLPVFGHAGTVVGDSIIYVDGAARNPSGNKPAAVASNECWIGKIDKHHPEKIAWNKLPPHPGLARYRIATGGSDKDQKAYFVGGSTTVYDYNGIGLDGTPAEPVDTIFFFNFRSNSWETIAAKGAAPTMDHSGLAVTSDGLIVVGGMDKNQAVVAAVSLYPKGK